MFVQIDATNSNKLEEQLDAVRMKLSGLETGLFAEYHFAKEESGFEVVDVC